ncbi:LysR family transcriptional regulator [Photobacterium swingsii]|uniref:LysR family transcriptional regulator n=1 Tax=Photobacterium swingsii TaxID=680026 RepID=A0A0J8VDL8_9GAMM|nr:LysR family transcriptional regulator [Photobacterium swingsii]KMV31381.1 LysR family transcriptional regulator [Photobacterium swingsii]PSW25118.1 LysR family transcriptional regulator [Photobacterium swingsii]
MDLRLLRFFVAVYEEQNITAAANRCYVSQPSISNAIKQLEEELGVTLFERHKKGVTLTEESHHLYPKAVQLMNEIHALPDLFTQRRQTTPIKIANFPDLSQTELARVMARLSENCPELRLELVDANDPHADCAITLDILKAEDEIFLPLWEEDYVLCMLPDHPLAQLTEVKPRDLHQYDFIECPPCEAHQQTISLLACDGLSLNLLARAEHKMQVMHLVQAGIGISFLPTGVLEQSKQLITVPLVGPRMFRRLGLTYAASKANSQALNSVIRALR